MNYNQIFFCLIIIVLIIIVVLYFFLFKLKKQSSDKKNIILSNNEKKKFYNLFKNIDDLDIYFDVEKDKLSQSKLIDLTHFMFYKSILDVSYSIKENFIKILNNNYEKSTANWYTKNIGIPKFFIFALYLNKKNIFTKENTKTIELCVSLLDKIFNTEQDIRDELANGIDVISYNLTYINLQKLYPQYLKKYKCHENKTYMDKNYKIIKNKFSVSSKFNKNGFYTDNSYIYHENNPCNLSYLLVLLEDYAFLTKNKIFVLPPENIKLISNCIKPFLNNKITFANPWSRGISRQRLKKNLYFTFIFYNDLNNNIIKNSELDIILYDKILSENTFNISTNYLMPMIGTYISYGKSYLDNYSINCLNSFIKIESTQLNNDGDLTSDLNINNNFNFQFGDEEIDLIYKYFNNSAEYLKKNVLLSGALLDKDNNIIKDHGWITDFIIKTKDIEIINVNIGNYINFFFIIDRVYNIVTVVFNNINSNNIHKICALTVFSTNDILSGFSEKDKNKIEIDSSISKRYLYTKLEKNIDEDVEYSYFSSCSVMLTPSKNVKDNYYFMTINKDHKLPEIEITDKIIKYSNNKNKFTITKNIQPKDYNITYKDSAYNPDKMFVLEFEKEKILQYCNYPYYSNTPLTANNKKFILDNQYRCYVNL